MPNNFRDMNFLVVKWGKKEKKSLRCTDGTKNQPIQSHHWLECSS